MDAPFRCVGRSLIEGWNNWPEEWLAACAFPKYRSFVCAMPSIHVAQAPALIAHLNAERAGRDQAPLTEEEEAGILADQVDLFVRKGRVQIRPDQDEADVANALRADEMLQEVLSKLEIEFLNTSYPAVRIAIKRQGELWRIAPAARTNAQIDKLIDESLVAIGEQRIYHYNLITGTRYLTFARLKSLSTLSLENLRRQLQEIATFSAKRNSKFRPELALFEAATDAPLELIRKASLLMLSPQELRDLHATACNTFAACCPPELQEDDPKNNAWNSRMACALTETAEKLVSEEVWLGLSPEFLLKVRWLPGGRIQNGAISLETDLGRHFSNPPAPNEEERFNDAPDPHEQVRGIIFNFFREYRDLEYINVGRVLASLGDRPRDGGRRGVYLVEIKQKFSPTEAVRIVRLQKWDVWIHLNEGKSWERAMVESAEYTDYVLDRRLGCQQLGMRVSQSITQHSFPETYRGSNRDMYGRRIWSVFFERDYMTGMVTSKIPWLLLKTPSYANALARLLGEAAAINMILGRADRKMRVVFDDGDEVLTTDLRGWPQAITVSDPTGAFTDYARDLMEVAADYARPYLHRRDHLGDPHGFLDAYLAGFIKRFDEVQKDYKRRRAALRGLFAHVPKDPTGNFSYRWDCVLNRLERSDPKAIAASIRAVADAADAVSAANAASAVQVAASAGQSC